MSKLLHCERVLDNKLLWILFLTNPLMLTLYGFIGFHFALVPINPQVRCALGNVVVFYLASRQQWLRKMLVSALSVVWTPWPTATRSMGLWHRGERALLCRFRYRTFLACRPLYLVYYYTIYSLSCRFDISHLFCAPLIMQDTKALAVCRYHWYAYLSYQIRILYQWYANISHRNTQLHWSGKSW